MKYFLSSNAWMSSMMSAEQNNSQNYGGKLLKSSAIKTVRG